jgi:hypothetical protein
MIDMVSSWRPPADHDRRAASGHAAAAPPSNVMKARRFIQSSRRQVASSVGLPPLVFSGALRVRRNHGDANMHGGHDLAPRLGVKPIGELVQPLVQSAPKLNAGGNR